MTQALTLTLQHPFNDQPRLNLPIASSPTVVGLFLRLALALRLVLCSSRLLQDVVCVHSLGENHVADCVSSQHVGLRLHRIFPLCSNLHMTHVSVHAWFHKCNLARDDRGVQQLNLHKRSAELLEKADER
ncbi:hypothetical protein TraAM80_04799 [Trypanosoma rangeli]|uniref:Uncharacterized protein n=1 Tax=Trypanosoma rangeli TaxID=5698 RepID=A0A422NHS2_TRYRA|nr:uncharacterized protein TraAM80_04799 [Trypanosoma rangeli]RNF05030.1 hypothetical protein TraAM80_04799 [Trypanosoma rangeli]|eukprot:RNF05030.1 hypothetical protein TraAM80_04799 [Trypanosoma rangeli]